MFRKKGDKSRPFLTKLFPDAQLGNNRAVAVDVLLGQVVQEVPALTDHHKEATAAVVVMLVNPQVLGELVDAGGKNGDLHLGRTGVALVRRILGNDLGFLFLLNHDIFHLSINSPAAKNGPVERQWRYPETEPRVINRNWP